MAAWIEAVTWAALQEEIGTAIRVCGQEIALFKKGDEVFAIENVCPHREAPIADGVIHGEIVTCPWHNWQINVRTGCVVYNETLCARTYRCKIENGLVYVEV
jgi:nitrite reductase (NADH) small subunit